MSFLDGVTFAGGNKPGGKGRVQFDKSASVWLNGLPAEITFSELTELGNQVGTCVWAQVLKQGQGLITFSARHEAEQSLHSLNGATIGDNIIEADLWEKNPKSGAGGAGGGGVSYSFAGDRHAGGTLAVFGGGRGSLGVLANIQKQDKGKGKGKGKHKQLEKSRTVWVTGLPDGCTFKDLMELGNQAGNCKWAEGPTKKGVGLIEYNSVEEMQQAASILNGASVGDVQISADPWVTPPGSGGGGRRGGGGGAPGFFGSLQSVKQEYAQPQFALPQFAHSFQPQQLQPFGQAKGKGKRKHKQLEKSKTVWVTGLPAECGFTELMELGKQAGNAVWAEGPTKKGVGLIQYPTVEEMQTAAALLNGASIGDVVIQADAWGNPDA